RPHPVALHEVAALREGHRVRADGLDVLDALSRPAEQTVLDPEVGLRDSEDVALQQQVVVDSHRAGDAVLHRDKSTIRLAGFDRVEDLLAERKPERLDRTAEMREQRRLAVGTANSLECDLQS